MDEAKVSVSKAPGRIGFANSLLEHPEREPVGSLLPIFEDFSPMLRIKFKNARSLIGYKVTSIFTILDYEVGEKDQ